MWLRPRRFCGVALFMAVLLAVAAVPARAQPASNPAAAGGPPGSNAVSATELQHLADALQDPAQRRKLIEQINALIAAERGAAKPPPAAAPPGNVIESLSQQIDAITGEILAAAQVVVDVPRLADWIKTQLGDKHARDFWIGVSVRLAFIFGIGFLANRAARVLMAGFARRVANIPGATVATEMLLVVLGFILDAAPVVAFAAAASFVVPFTHGHFGTRRVAEVLIGAILWAGLVLAGARAALLSPNAARLYSLGGESRQYLYIWVRRFTIWAIYGFAVAAASWWLGVPGAIYALTLRVTVLVLAILAIVFVLQNRATVAEWLRGGEHGTLAWRMVRQRLADTWHVLAIIYIVGTFGVFVLNISGGFLFLLRATVITVVVLLAATLAVRAIAQTSRRGFAIKPELKQRYPTLETRANRYLPVLSYATSAIIDFFAALAILEAWGVDAFAWLGTANGRRLTGTLVTIAIVLISALVLWELFSSAIERYLSASDGDGRPRARSARVRTLLPLMRNAVLIVLTVMVALIVLSQIGVNIAPLLAGAGVIGLAIGFGSQALIKDLINGLFILIEDTFAVGDVVDVGNNHAGLVEAMSIRTIRLRDLAGTVHTVPFSEVTAIKNLTKEFSYYVVDVGISYREDTDAVVAVLREVAEEMRKDPAFAALILEPMEVLGVDRFEDSAVIVKIRFKTPPIQQWTVGREFNRRMKKAFDERNIEMPFPHRTLYFGVDRAGGAPPARIAIEPRNTSDGADA